MSLGVSYNSEIMARESLEPVWNQKKKFKSEEVNEDIFESQRGKLSPRVHSFKLLRSKTLWNLPRAYLKLWLTLTKMMF